MLDSPLPSASAIASAILASPGWCRVGLSVRDPDLRECAAETMATTIVDKLAQPDVEHDPDQMALPLV